MSNDRLKILLTEGSSVTARQVLYVLGRKHAIDILDPSAFCQARFSQLVRRWIKCPALSKDPLAYLRFLIRLLRRENYDVLLPTHEQVYLLSRVRKPLQQLTGIAVSDFELIDRIHNKASFSRLCDELDIPQPATNIVATHEAMCDHDRLPCYAKLAYGTAGQGVVLVQNKSELEKLADVFAEARVFDRDEVLLQEPIDAEHEAVGGLFQHGKLMCGGGIRAIVLGVGGGPTAIENFCREEALDHIRRLGEHLCWHGPIGFGYIYDPKDGQSKFIDANPRMGGTVNGWLSGGNFGDVLLQVARERQPVLIGPSLIGQRTHQTFVNLISLAVAGENRRSILRELWHACLGQGVYKNSEDELTRPYEDPLSLVPASAVTMLLLALPRAAQWLVRSTVNNYSVGGDVADVIRNLPDEELLRCFDVNRT